MTRERAKDVVVVPRRVPELHHMLDRPVATAEAQPGGNHIEEAEQPIDVLRKMTGKLVQHRTEAGAELRRVVEESLYRLLGLAKTLEMGEVPAGLHRHHEPGRRLLLPRRESFRIGQAVERGVGFDRVELRDVVLEPSRCRQPFRVETPTPTLVVPSGAADVDARGRLTGGQAASETCASRHGSIPSGGGRIRTQGAERNRVPE